MAQLSFFDADKRLAALSAKGDPLQAIDKLVPWESFRADIEAVVLTPTAERSRIHERAARQRPLGERQQNANRKKSKVRARVEHVFGAQETAPGGRLVRSIGIARARAKIGLQNLVYNMRRLATLERMAAA